MAVISLGQNEVVEIKHVGIDRHGMWLTIEVDGKQHDFYRERETGKTWNMELTDQQVADSFSSEVRNSSF